MYDCHDLHLLKGKHSFLKILQIMELLIRRIWDICSHKILIMKHFDVCTKMYKITINLSCKSILQWNSIMEL